SSRISAMSAFLDDVRAVAAELFQPGRFFTTCPLEFHHTDQEELTWEIFQGRLLDITQTRQRCKFEAWHVRQGSNEQPVHSLLLDTETRRLHVVRSIDSYVHEAYDAGGNVYLTREVRRPLRELVRTLVLEEFADRTELRDELEQALQQAIVGT